MQLSRDQSAALLLCAVAGFVDALGYAWSGVFAANMTGNTVLAGISLAHQDWRLAGERASTVLLFFVGAGLGRLILRIFGDRASAPLVFEAAIIAAAGAMHPESRLVVSLLALAMGVQATAATKFMGLALSTVVVTSTMARLAENAADRLIEAFRPSAASSTGRSPLLMGAWLCYGLGAGGGIFCLTRVSAPLALAGGLILLVAGILVRDQ